MTFNYSELFLKKLVKDVLQLDKSKVIIWEWNYPFASDVRNVFKQTKEEDKELTDYYDKFFKVGMTTMEKATAIAKAVNERITYGKDIDIYGKLEYWASPIETHRKRTDDCDGYSNLIVYVLRLFGAQPYEVFTRAGEVEEDGGKILGHAHPIILNKEDMKFYPIEGSFYPARALNNFGKVPIGDNQQYNKETWFITNDVLSFSDYPIIRFVR